MQENRRYWMLLLVYIPKMCIRDRLLPVSYTIEDEIYQELLRKVGSSAIEEIHKIEDEQKEYEDYIEPVSYTHLDMLRDNLESSREKELEFQKEKKTLILSLAHDLKTCLLYTSRCV